MKILVLAVGPDSNAPIRCPFTETRHSLQRVAVYYYFIYRARHELTLPSSNAYYNALGRLLFVREHSRSTLQPANEFQKYNIWGRRWCNIYIYCPFVDHTQSDVMYANNSNVLFWNLTCRFLVRLVQLRSMVKVAVECLYRQHGKTPR